MHHSAAFRVEPLEPRTMLAVFTVTTAAHDGPGSLREAIRAVNAWQGADDIRFSIPVPDNGVAVIRLESELDVLDGPAAVQGFTQPGMRPELPIRVRLVPANETVTTGLRIGGGVTVEGLSVTGFSGAGIVVGRLGDGTTGGGNSVRSNIIAFNGGPGVAVTGDSSGNTIRFNSIHSNAVTPLDLGGDGPTPNDGPGDGDTGANGLQNFPVVRLSPYPRKQEDVHGVLESRPNARFVIDLYLSEFFGSPGNSFHAKTFEVVTDATGRATFTTNLSLLPHRTLAATATDSETGSTSEFGPGPFRGDGLSGVVVALYVRGTRWAPAFLRELEEEGLGSETLGFRVPAGSAAEDELPWVNVDQVSVEFRGEVPGSRAADDLVIRSGAGIPYGLAPGGFSFDPQANAATWTLDRPLGDFSASRRQTADRVDLDFGDGALVQRLNIVPGDANRNGGVAPTDYGNVRSAVGRSTLDEGTAPKHYTVFKDLNANGNISPTDFGLARGNHGAILVPVPEPAAPTPAGPTSAGTTDEWFAMQPLL